MVDQFSSFVRGETNYQVKLKFSRYYESAIRVVGKWEWMQFQRWLNALVKISETGNKNWLSQRSFVQCRLGFSVKQITRLKSYESEICLDFRSVRVDLLGSGGR